MFIIVVLLLLIIVSSFNILKIIKGGFDWNKDYGLILLPIISLFLAVFCNRIFTITDTFEYGTLWPGYLYILLLLNIFTETTAIQALVHGSLGILIIYDLLKVNYNQSATVNCYNIGLYIGLAAMLNNVMLLAVPFLLLGIQSIKTLSYKEYALYFLGIVTPIYFIYAGCFLIGNYQYWTNFLDFSLWINFTTNISIGNWIEWALIIVCLISVLVITFIQYNSLPVYIRRLSSALLYLIGIATVIAMVSGFSGFLIFYLAPAFAFFATMLMLKYSNKVALDKFHFIFVLLIIGIQLLNGFLKL